MWLKQFKIALIEKDPDTVEKLIEEIPQFETVEEMQQASALLIEGMKFIQSLKDETHATMKQMKKNIEFLKSTQPKATSNLDLTL